MDEKQAFFEQLTYSDLKMCNSTALNSFNNESIRMKNNSDNKTEL